MKAMLQRSNRTGGTTVGSTKIRYPGLSGFEILSHTLATDDDSHTIVSHLPRKRQKGLRKPRTCREVLRRGQSPVGYLIRQRRTLCASSTNNTLPAVPMFALVKIRITISNNPQADFGSINGSERSTIVN